MGAEDDAAAAQDRRAVEERRIVEIAYVLLTGLVLVAVPAVAGHLLGWGAHPLYLAALVVLAVVAALRAVVILVSFERRLRAESRGPGAAPPEG